MILTCPACRTRFLVPDATFSGRASRRVRCSRCRHEWLADAPVVAMTAAAAATAAGTFSSQLETQLASPLIDHRADHLAAQLADAPAVPVEPIPAGSNLPVKIRRRLLSNFLPRLQPRQNIALLTLLLVLALTALLMLSPVAPAAFDWLHDKLSMQQAPRLLISNVTTRYVPQIAAAPSDATTGTTTTDTLGTTVPIGWTLVVEGTVENRSDGEETIPPLRLMTRDKAGALLGSFTPVPQQAVLPPHGATGFSFTLGAADPQLAEVTVQFGGQFAGE